MKVVGAWLLCLLLLGLALQGAASRAHQHSMEIRSECPNPPPPPAVTAGGPGHFLGWGILAKHPGAGVWPPVPQTLPLDGPDSCSQGSQPSTWGRVTAHQMGGLGLSARGP